MSLFKYLTVNASLKFHLKQFSQVLGVTTNKKHKQYINKHGQRVKEGEEEKQGEDEEENQNEEKESSEEEGSDEDGSGSE